jgi:hypothetical protein
MSTFIDTVGIPEIFCEALARVERIGPNRRLVFITTQPDGQGGLERAAVVKIILPAEIADSVAHAMLGDGPPLLAFDHLAMTVAN